MVDLLTSYSGSIVGLHAQFIGFGYAISNWIGFAVYYAKGQFTVGELKQLGFDCDGIRLIYYLVSISGRPPDLLGCDFVGRHFLPA
jgi:hypothetical protein